MHSSLRFLANIFVAILSFLLLGNIVDAIRVPEQRLVAKRKPTSTTGGAYAGRQRRNIFMTNEGFLADCPPYPLPSNRCTQNCGPNEVAKVDGSCGCPADRGYYYNNAGYCGLQDGSICTSDDQCQTQHCDLYSIDGDGNEEKRCRNAGGEQR